jgi:exoribonuclease R
VSRRTLTSITVSLLPSTPVRPCFPLHPAQKIHLNHYFPSFLADFTSPIRRYADVLAHRQLSAAIGYTPLHSTLSSKQHVERVLENVNRRHRMAQMAGRASVEFYVGLALKARGTREGKEVEVKEDAFVIRCFRNGVAVYVHKFVDLL